MKTPQSTCASLIIPILLLGIWIAAAAIAETNPVSASSQLSNSSSQSDSFASTTSQSGSSGNKSGLQKLEFEAPTLKKAEQPKPSEKENDRAESAKQAAQQAQQAADHANQMAMMLMQQAAEEKDPEAKKSLMRMAQMQQMSAMSSQAAAKQNSESRKQLSAEDIPKMAEYTAGKVKLVNDDSTEEPEIKIPEFEKTSEDTKVGALSEQLADTKLLAPTVDILPKKEDAKAEAKVDDKAVAPSGTRLDDKIPLGEINERRLAGVDPSAPPTSSNVGMDARQPFTSPSTTAKASTSESPKEKEGTKSQLVVASGERRPSSVGAKYQGPQSGGENGQAAGSSSFDQILSQMMGGGPSDYAMDMSAQVVPTQAMEKATEGLTETPTLFDYASVVFTRLKYEKKRLGLKDQSI